MSQAWVPEGYFSLLLEVWFSQCCRNHEFVCLDFIMDLLLCMVDSTIVVIYSYFFDLILGWTVTLCAKLLCVPIYYEICDDGRHVDNKTTYFQLVFYTNTTNFKDLSV